MWFFGFSTTNPRNYWIIGAIILVIILTLILKHLAIYLEYSHKHNQEDDESERYKGSSKIDCSKCCSGAIRTYALEELKSATRDFRIRIGVGATSVVYLAELGDGQFGAVKRVMEEKGGSKKMFLDEVSVLLRISHPNLVGLLGFCLDKGEQLLLLEYVPNKSLFDRMHTRHGQSSGTLSWSSRLSIALDIARALDYLHSVADPAVIHRDVKSSNILLVNDNHAKLADFGLCKLGHDIQSAQTPTTIKGSLGYVDTCYLNTGLVSPKSDVYSFGVLLLELITGLKSVQGSTTLAEWTEECRKNKNVEVMVGMLDSKLKGDVNVQQLHVLIDVANLALLENCHGRPDMNYIVDRISSCMEPDIQPELPV
ncbi:probable receptor-like protein kinase At1g49730 [Cornus florida]|uniref:probable receptor-like protein kinase At1g49730 n=1 Tax=Cornus florida TaxID=4283 RepID=UPI0028A0F755|nr:probable receptor-like protein kinase At1g49730 [Cornus florida]